MTMVTANNIFKDGLKISQGYVNRYFNNFQTKHKFKNVNVFQKYEPEIINNVMLWVNIFLYDLESMKRCIFYIVSRGVYVSGLDFGPSLHLHLYLV